ncbi:MAG: hypothetical protein JWN31_296 [Frankiales bacterium]|nr:hypothetical protein [Frankiales bacterium]
MEHVVFFPAHDGSPAFRRVASLQDAVRLVEHLRNVEGVNEVSVHSLEEVPMAFKPYYKVEIPGVEEAPAGPTGPAAAAAQAPVPAPEPAPAPAPITVAAPEPAAVQAVPQLAVAVPEQGEAPAGDTVASAAAADEEKATLASKEAGAASLGFFAN